MKSFLFLFRFLKANRFSIYKTKGITFVFIFVFVMKIGLLAHSTETDCTQFNEWNCVMAIEA